MPVDQELDKVKWGFPVVGLDEDTRHESDQNNADSTDQLIDLMNGAGSFRNIKGLRLLAWDVTLNRWRAWVAEPDES